MDAKSDKAIQWSTPHSFAIDNCNTRGLKECKFLDKFDDTGACSSLTRNKAITRDSVDGIIKKYKNERLKSNDYPYSNHILYRNTGKHALFRENTEFGHSVQDFHPDDVDHKYTTNLCKTGDIFSLRSNVCTKCNSTLEENNKIKVASKKGYTVYHMDAGVDQDLTSNEKLYADKTTYCRPVLSLYNEQFIYKTMERNSRLKQLVKKLALARQQEKENVSWNNFINELKNKHGFNCNESCQPHPLQSEPVQYITPDVIDDCYNTRFSWDQSRLCRNLLQDVYGVNELSQPAPDSKQPQDSTKLRSYTRTHADRNTVPYHTDSQCYPTSSQGRLTVLERERKRREHLDQWYNRLSNYNLKYKNNKIDKTNSKEQIFGIRNELNKVISLKTANNKDLINNPYQTIKIFQDIEENKSKNEASHNPELFSIAEPMKTCDKNNKLIENHQDVSSNMKKTSLINIETKLETLICSINSFINEIKSNRKSKRNCKYRPMCCEMCKITNKKINLTRSDTIGVADMISHEKLFYDNSNNTSTGNLSVCNFCTSTHRTPSKIDDIFKEVHKHNPKEPCSVHITFEVPTKDCSTEVTKSLSKQRNFDDKIKIIEEISTAVNTPIQKMTIAVNTDPLSFLSLLRISTEVLKGLLSYMPNIDYYSYLSLLHFPQIKRKNDESHFICNICGAAFSKPSKLSDHIQEHNLGKTRDCCVCRHAIDARRKSSLFRCQFCGQRFTRAYCCELHQQCCARRLGLAHDVTSSLMLLR